MSAVPLAWLGYLLLPIAGAVAVSRHGDREQKCAELLLFGPLVLALAMLALSAAGIPLTRASVAATVVAALLVRVVLQRRRAAAAAERVSPWPFALALAAALVAALLAVSEPIVISDPVFIYAPAGVQYAAHGRIDPALLRSVDEMGHADYPPLFAANLAWLYLCAGGFDPWIGKLLGPWFLLALLLELAALARRSGIGRGRLLAAAAIGLAPGALLAASNGFADIVLTAYLAGAIASVIELANGPALPAPPAMNDEGRRARRAALVRASLCLAAAALTKIEGAVVGALLLLLATALRTADGRRLRLRDAAFAGAPLLGVAVAWWFVTWRCGLENDLVAGIGRVSPGEALARSGTVAAAFVRDWIAPLDARSWIPAWGVAPLLVLLAAPFVVRGGVRERRLALEAVLLPAQLLLYAGVLLFTPYDVAWHLSTSVPRILLHCLPAALAFVLAGASDYGTVTDLASARGRSMSRPSARAV